MGFIHAEGHYLNTEHIVQIEDTGAVRMIWLSSNRAVTTSETVADLLKQIVDCDAPDEDGYEGISLDAMRAAGLDSDE